MPIQVATGHPNYSGTFIPELWSNKLLEKFYTRSIFSSITNTDYEGTIRQQGDKIKIRTIPTLEIDDYQVGGTLRIQRPTSNNVEINIDYAKTFSFIIDDIVKAQSDINMMNAFADDAGQQLNITIDRHILNSIVPDFASTNKGATAGVITGDINLGAAGAPLVTTSANILSTLMSLNEVLTQQNTPEDGRFFVIPAWVATMLKQSDLKQVDITGDSQSPLRNGRIGTIDNTEIFVSNNILPVLDGGNKCYNIIAGHRKGTTFATQLTQTETLKSESTFGTIMRGLQVYGFKVLQPTVMAAAYVRK